MMNAPRARMTHELKTWPEFFIETRGGRKKFELRKNDRDFRVGDQLLLKEWDPKVYQKNLPSDHRTVEDIQAAIEAAYTGREFLVRVDYIMGAAYVAGFGYRGISPIDRGYVIMSISLIS